MSVDGTEDVHDKIRGVQGAYRKAISAFELLNNLKKVKYPSLRVLMDALLMKPNLNEIIDVVNLAKELDARFGLGLIDKHSYADSGSQKDGCYFVPEIDMTDLCIDDQKELDNVLDKLHLLKAKNPEVFHATTTHASLEYIRNYFPNSHRKDIPCMLGHTTISIGAHGQVYACPGLGPEGNIREKSINAILTSEKYRKKLRSIFYKRCSGCTCGYSMNYLHCIPGIKDELLWRVKLFLK